MAAAIRVSLAVGERWQLETLRRTAKDGRLILRAQVILLTADGKSVGEIVQLTGLQPAAITKWRKRYVAEGIGGLYDRARPGGPPKITPRYLTLLRKTVMRSPRKMGYAFTVWTSERLAEYLAIRTGIRISGAWVLELLKHQLGFSHQRPKHTLRGKRDERKHRIAQKELEALKKGLSSPTPPTSSGTRTKRSSIFTRTSRRSGLREDGSLGSSRPGRTGSGWSSEPSTSAPGNSPTTSARRKGLRVFMTW